jgi:hypothetical protein
MTVISFTVGFAMYVCMAYWPSQELLSGFVRCSMDLLFQEMMIYGDLSRIIFGLLTA